MSAEQVVLEALSRTNRREDEAVDAHLARQAATVVALLEDAGHIAVAPEVTVQDMAEWLAEKSDSPRLTRPDGWRELLASKEMVEFAYAKAKARGLRPADLNPVRDHLLAHVAHL